MLPRQVDTLNKSMVNLDFPIHLTCREQARDPGDNPRRHRENVKVEVFSVVQILINLQISSEATFFLTYNHSVWFH